MTDILNKRKEGSQILAETHQVLNQPPILQNFNSYLQDKPLVDAVKREGGAWGIPKIQNFGEILGQAHWIKKGFQANQNIPVFHSHDRYGNRIDKVEYHPAYHELMDLAISHQVPSLPWLDPKIGSHVVRMALNYLYNQVDAGSACPLTMTFACTPVLQKHNISVGIGQNFVSKILNQNYDSQNCHINKKSGLTIGMAMTEKQGGTDVRANTTRAYPLLSSTINNDNDAYELIGHKWFCSAPMSDAFLTLAQTEDGLTCFLVPRWRDEGLRNAFYIQRLKDKMGNKSNASSEIEFRGALAYRIGDEGRGVATIIDMVSLTRYDCMIGSTALMRQAIAQVTHHISYRSVFGEKLINQPLMQNVVADLCLEVEAALAMTMRVARALDNTQDESEKMLVRLCTTIGKYSLCKNASRHIGEAQECLGGIGYVEESIMPRLYREAPVNSIWEGSGNVQCLDVKRAITKTPVVLDVFFNELATAKSDNKHYDNFVVNLKSQLKFINEDEGQLRYYVENMSKAMQAAQLIKAGHSSISDAFCQSRLAENRGNNYGVLAKATDFKKIIARAKPEISL